MTDAAAWLAEQLERTAAEVATWPKWRREAHRRATEQHERDVRQAALLRADVAAGLREYDHERMTPDEAARVADRIIERSGKC